MNHRACSYLEQLFKTRPNLPQRVLVPILALQLLLVQHDLEVLRPLALVQPLILHLEALGLLDLSPKNFVPVSSMLVSKSIYCSEILVAAVTEFCKL